MLATVRTFILDDLSSHCGEVLTRDNVERIAAEIFHSVASVQGFLGTIITIDKRSGDLIGLRLEGWKFKDIPIRSHVCDVCTEYVTKILAEGDLS